MESSGVGSWLSPWLATWDQLREWSSICCHYSSGSGGISQAPPQGVEQNHGHYYSLSGSNGRREWGRIMAVTTACPVGVGDGARPL